jgi:mxaA protein
MKRSAAMAVMLCAASWVFGAEAPRPESSVIQPRAFGYVIGDIATQRVLLEQQGHSFTPTSLPASGSLGNWVERHASRIERDANGREWLAVEYQVMNSPQALTAITLPAWKLKEKSSSAELQVPEWQITVGPLTPERPFAQSGLGALRPDRVASLIDVASLQRWIGLWTTAAIVLLLAWAGWWAWRNWRASLRQPFAKALRELRDLDDRSPEAWYSVHRAFDATAGRVVQRETMSALFEKAPQFASQRAAIERFLDASVARFFDVPLQASASAVSLRALCSDLRQIEKRHET